MKTLDLRGLNHKDVEKVVAKFIDSNWVDGDQLVMLTGPNRKIREIVKNAVGVYAAPYITSSETFIIVKCIHKPLDDMLEIRGTK